MRELGENARRIASVVGGGVVLVEGGRGCRLSRVGVKTIVFYVI